MVEKDQKFKDAETGVTYTVVSADKWGIWLESQLSTRLETYGALHFNQLVRCGVFKPILG